MVDQDEDEVLTDEDVFDDLSLDMDDAEIADVDSDDLDVDVLDEELEDGVAGELDDEEPVDPDTLEDVDADTEGENAGTFGDEFDATGAGVPPTATFDVDDDDAASSSVFDDDDDEDDAVREGEFVCRSCFMAKRESALGDEERSLCLDCV